MDVTGLLERVSPDDGGGWVGWCPEAGGCVTQERTAVGLIAMLGDAAHVMVETSLLRSWSAMDCESGQLVDHVQRVTHPNRLLDRVKDKQIWGDDEWWPQYEAFIARYERGGDRPVWDNITPRELDDGTERFAFIEGHLEWYCAGGVIIVNNPFASHSYQMRSVYVPAMQITAIGSESRQRVLTKYVRASTFDPSNIPAIEELWGIDGVRGFKLEKIFVGKEPSDLPDDSDVWVSSSESCPF